MYVVWQAYFFFFLALSFSTVCAVAVYGGCPEV